MGPRWCCNLNEHHGKLTPRTTVCMFYPQTCSGRAPLFAATRLDQTGRIARQEWRLYRILQDSGRCQVDVSHRISYSNESVSATVECLEREWTVSRMDPHLSSSLQAWRHQLQTTGHLFSWPSSHTGYVRANYFCFGFNFHDEALIRTLCLQSNVPCHIRSTHERLYLM